MAVHHRDHVDLEAPALRAPPVFYRSVWDFLRQLPGAAQRFWLLVIVTGAVSGLGSVLMLRLLRAVQDLAWGPGASPLDGAVAVEPWRRVLVPTSAGVLIAVVSLVMHAPLGGHGTARIIESIWLKKGRLPLGRAWLRGILSVVAVACGASLGREGPLIQTGAATGSWLADRFRITRRQARLLVACGAASGIAAAYNVPIGGALFGLEVLLGSFALELLGPIVVSTVVATIISRILAHDHPTYLIPEYVLTHPRELLLGLAMAPVLGIASALYVRVVSWVEVMLERLPRRLAPLWPPLAMFTLGVAALRFPQLLGNGYATVNAALLGDLTLKALLVLPFLKLAATALCAGAGIPGGLFTPSLFYGALLGGALGHVASEMLGSVAPSGAYALIGMAAVLAGTTHAAVSAVLIIFELTGDYGLILPLMLTSALAAGAARMIDPDSLYTGALTRKGIRLPELPRPEWLRTTPVIALVSPDYERVPPTMPFEPLVAKLLSLPPGHDLYVTTDSGKLIGIILLDEMKGHIREDAHLGMVRANDVMRRDLEPISSTMTLAEVAARFGDTDLERLPVVDEDGRLVGTVSKRSLVRHGRF